MNEHQRVILFHGFSDPLFDRLTRGVQALLPEDQWPALASTNQDDLEKTVEELVLHILETGKPVVRERPIEAPEELVIYIHGFPRDILFSLVNGLKMLLPDRRAVAFCTSTKNNISMKISDLIPEVRGDHAFMTGQSPAPKT